MLEFENNYLISFLREVVIMSQFTEYGLCFSFLKVRYPDRITLIRGNHESRQITQVC